MYRPPLTFLLPTFLAAAAHAQYTTPTTLSLPSAVVGNVSASENYDYLCPNLRYHNCAIVGHIEACCDLGDVCALDDSGNIACCPFQTQCVGTLGQNSGSGSGIDVRRSLSMGLGMVLGVVMASEWIF